MIDVINVTKKYGDFTAISDLSFKVNKASIYGLVGYNGAGKTTLLKVISGVFKPEGGKVEIFGENVYENPAVKQRLFYVPDDLYFRPYASMEKMARFYKGYYPKFSESTFNNLAEVFELDKSKRINGFSKGMQRQAELVLGLATHPDILLLDESFDGLDPAKRNVVKKLVLEYVAEKECTVIISSHNLHELGDLCDNIGLINGKKIVLDASVDELSKGRKRYRLVFDRDVIAEDFAGLEIKKFAKDGKIVSFSVSGDLDAAEAKIREMNPILIESFPLSVEEIFLEEMEGTGYDFSKIFS
ncbi:MAG TPA: ABC transporter ATP-binding protein [Clostridiales bacterium]|nr:ABC transporter ATP-binding protein [Clostridiales bacterium]